MDTQSKRTYTRRTTRDRVVALLEEAISLVKARCVEPIKGSPENMLQKSKLEFQKAVQIKQQANAVLEESSRRSHYPVEAINAENISVNAPLAPLPVELSDIPQELAPVTSNVAVRPAVNISVKKRKSGSCPGGPKAFNEFLKAKRPEVEAQLLAETGQAPPYTMVRERISKLWRESCQAPTKNTTRRRSKVPKTPSVVPSVPQTPGRVNANVPLVSNVKSEMPLSRINEGSEEEIPEVTEIPAVPEVTEATEATEIPAVPEATEAIESQYNDLGMNNAVGLRKVTVKGKPFYMTNTNGGLFKRESDTNSEVGSFVGYFRNGNIVYQDEPDEA
jgi:hypothetical protein